MPPNVWFWDARDATKLYDDLLSGKVTLDEIEKSPTLDLIAEQLDLAKGDLNKSCTSKLWLQYVEMISILQVFLRAERTGNWLMHRTVITKSLQFFCRE